MDLPSARFTSRGRLEPVRGPRDISHYLNHIQAPGDGRVYRIIHNIWN